MAVYESLIQGVRTWVIDVLALSDPNNEVIPEAEGEDQGHRPTPRPYYTVGVLALGERTFSEEFTATQAGLFIRSFHTGQIRITGYGEGAYDGLLELASSTFRVDLIDPMLPLSLSPISGVIRAAEQFPGESRIEPIGFVDFDIYYTYETVPGTETPIIEAQGVDIDTEICPPETGGPTEVISIDFDD